MLSYEELEAGVIKKGECSVCGACISACPLYYIQMIDGIPVRPRKKAACKSCGVCFSACYLTQSRKEMEGGIGKFIRVISARMTDETEACQDGGAVTAVINHALETGLIDGALLTGDESWRPVPLIAKSRSEIISSAKTKYGTSPVLAKLRSALIEDGLRRIAIVGLPCHIRSAENLKSQKIEPLDTAISLTVGLFCTRNIEYDRVKEKVHSFGLKMEEVKKFSIHDGFFNIHSADDIHRVPLKETPGWTPGYCPCVDYTCEPADISVGSGQRSGSSTVIVRTEKGEEIVRQLEKKGILITEPVHDLDLLFKESEKKKFFASKPI